ncbi:MAG: SOS response-associated peptidase [Chloroflexota bacterium]
MCGRYTLNAEPEAVQREFDLTDTPTLVSRYNIAPTQPVAIITNQDSKSLTLVRWGLIPSWSKDPKSNYSMINARSETADSKPSYRAAFKRRRCLIPTTGFYEWIKTEDGKQPYFIHRSDADLFAFAGLWEIWNGVGGEEIWSCTILTTDANDKIKHLHHRMPVILDKEEQSAWLDNDEDPQALKTLLTPYDADKMAFYPVSKAVNNVRNDNPMLIERDEPPKQQSLF